MRLLAAAFLLLLATPLQALTTDAWLRDFRQLLDEVSTHYANLDSVIEDRRVDLTALRKRTEERIRAAKSDDEAKRAIEQFLEAFGDGHADVRWSKPASSEPPAEDKRPLCERLGFASRDSRALDFTRFSDFAPLAGDDAATFPAGILRIDEKRRAGILRIELFSELLHPALCSVAQKSLALANDATCVDECEHGLHNDVSNLLTAALERRVEALAAAGATTLVVDITGNGGGSDWVEPAARVLTTVPLRSPRLVFLRHPHWLQQLRERLEDVQSDRKEGRGPIVTLESAAAGLYEAIDEAKKPCDRSGLWSDPPKKPDCSLIVSRPLFSTGLMPYAAPGKIDPELQSRNVLFLPSRYRYREGVNKLPLVVLVDGNTASASELFASMMQDNKAATIVGTATRGSGCGHTNGGIKATLRESGGELRLPDCVRLRADGSNEVLGVTPDVLVPWRTWDSRFQRAMKARRALETVVK